MLPRNNYLIAGYEPLSCYEVVGEVTYRVIMPPRSRLQKADIYPLVWSVSIWYSVRAHLA